MRGYFDLDDLGEFRLKGVAQSAAGNGQVLGIMAEAGTGKRRLCFEFLDCCRAKGMRVFERRAVVHGRSIPFLPILDVLRAYFGITAKDDDAAAWLKIAGHMMVLDQAGAATLASRLLEWRAELAAVLGDGASRQALLSEAVDAFEAIGAWLQAARIRQGMAA